MKRILTATAIAAALTAGNAQAGSDNKPFNVNITLIGWICVMTTRLEVVWMILPGSTRRNPKRPVIGAVILQ